MKSTNYYRNRLFIKNTLTSFFKEHLICILFFNFIFLFGFLIGIFFCSGNSSNIGFENFFDQKFVQYLSLECGNWSFFLSNVISFLIICLISIFLHTHIIFIIFNSIICLIRGYILGFNTVCILSLFSVLSIIFSLFIYVIFLLIANMLYCIICALSYKKYKEIKKFGCQCNPYRKKQFLKLQILFMFFILLILLLQCLLLFLIKSTFVMS